jgi:hypothetical protein
MIVQARAQAQKARALPPELALAMLYQAAGEGLYRECGRQRRP